ncbi:MAG: alginate lyase family protein [Myxococcales bacterium]
MPGSLDLGYLAYLATNVPPWDIARAVAVRARRAVRAGVPKALTPFFFETPQALSSEILRKSIAGRRPSIADPAEREATAHLLRERYPEACRFILREADASRRGEVPVFGKWKDCRKYSFDADAADAAPIDYDADPIGHEIRYDVSVPGPRVNLFQPGADAKAAWEVGRLQQLWRYGQARWLAQTATERSAWARAWIATIRQFRADCPVGMGVQWSVAMEVSSRAFHVALSFAYVMDDPVVDAKVLGEVAEMLDEHCAYSLEHLEETAAVRTNHYAADLVGPVVVGSLFPELPRARYWREQIGRRLWTEIERQSRPDGTHFESSTGYQRLTAELFLGAVLAARAGSAPAPRSVERCVSGLFRSLGDLLKPSGNIPQIGDLDSCRGLPLMPRAALDCGYLPALGAAALQDPALKNPSARCPVEVAWLFGASGVQRFEALPAHGRTGSHLLPDAGVAVLRSGDGHLCLTSGPNGQGGCGGHAHNDKNSIELSWGNVDLVLDRGTYVYARDPRERDARRGTAAHSTVQIDGAEQNRIIPGRLFALPDTARARIRFLGRSGGWEMASGEHAGYQRLANGVVHRRLAALSGERRMAVVQDDLFGTGRHVIELRYHVPHTDVNVRAVTAGEMDRLQKLPEHGFAPDGFDAMHAVEVGVGGAPFALFAFATPVPFQVSVDDSDVSPGYAERAPARTITVRLSGRMPVKVWTAILVLAGEGMRSLEGAQV